ncbi:MAG: FtsW/RodA/SpoVE family cell cycle protein, partial [Lachnospiraceae bacterium]|nr:FtsW/RodA/SpoVE family cell cycle protein [Lachnospiraceae bacterium]
MINIICEISKYLIILFMILYTVKCFSVMSSGDEEIKRKKLNKQIVYVFVIHFLCYLTMYLR